MCAVCVCVIFNTDFSLGQYNNKIYSYCLIRVDYQQQQTDRSIRSDSNVCNV